MRGGRRSHRRRAQLRNCVFAVLAAAEPTAAARGRGACGVGYEKDDMRVRRVGLGLGN